MSEIRLVETSIAAPEQYDAFVGDRQVGYLRLRNGKFTVNYLHSGGEEIYKAQPKGDLCFEENEREFFLDQARKAIQEKLNEVQFRALSFENPEQYDAIIGDMVVGYVRLHNGRLTVNYLYPGGEEIYVSDAKGSNRMEDDEREFLLEKAAKAIRAWLDKKADVEEA